VANATLLNSVQQKAYFNFLIATRVRAHSVATTQFRKSLLAKFSNGLGDFLWGVEGRSLILRQIFLCFTIYNFTII